ncbi:Homeobox protein [Fasciola gigantica]|uniref:Homeobox protein n=1 Tax=Fasciola gigantica TaxID=46835 RepID=A0A504Z831_FASGI|nr:Homeobox protein [Fasciola gigantica]
MCQPSRTRETVSANDLDTSTRVLDLSLRRTELDNTRRTDRVPEPICDQKEHCQYASESWLISSDPWLSANIFHPISKMEPLTIVPSPEELLARTRALRSSRVDSNASERVDNSSNHLTWPMKQEAVEWFSCSSPPVSSSLPAQPFYTGLMLDPLYHSVLTPYPTGLMSMSPVSPLKELRANYDTSSPSVQYSPLNSKMHRHVSCRSESEITHDSAGISKPRQYRKARAYFQPQHMKSLEAFFQKSPYLSTKDRELLAKQLNLSEDRIRTWFQNRRMREKRNPERFARHLGKFQMANHSSSSQNE